MQLAVGLCGCDTVLGQPGSASGFSSSLTLSSCYSQGSPRRGMEVIGLSVLFVPEIHTNKTWWKSSCSMSVKGLHLQWEVLSGLRT